MTQPLTDLVEQFCNFQRKRRGKTEGGVRTYRWNLEQFLVFVRNHDGRLARVTDLTTSMVQAWMDDMAAEDLALSTMRVRQSDRVELLRLACEARSPHREPGGQARTAPAPPGAAETGPWVVDHGRARGGREGAPSAA